MASPIAAQTSRNSDLMRTNENQDLIQANGHTSIQANGDYPIQINGDNHKEDDESLAHEEDQGSTTVNVGEAPNKKKKKSKKSKSKRGANAPSGFEEYYVDAPLTPAEFEEEKGLYHAERNFSGRIETAIQRYVSKRRLDSIRSSLFNRYLVYGGVEVSPNMFQGMDSKAFESMDTGEILAATATAHVSSDKDITRVDGSKWVVDFEGCTKGFLSSRLPIMSGLGTQAQVKSLVGTIRNFLNYLLHHDVCPEYADQINATRRLCDLAEEELWQISQVGRWLPGDFNVACSTIFNGSHQGTYSADYRKWLPDGAGLVGMSDEVAKEVVKFGIAAADTAEQALRFHELDQANNLRVVRVHETGFEITEIHFANGETRNFYKEQSADFRILGRLKAKPWVNPALPPPDLTEEEEKQIALKEKPSSSETELEFLVEDATLRFMFVGMKIEATVRELNCGLKYFDSVIAVYPSFHVVLPNEMMLGWKKPKLKTGREGDESEDEGKVESRGGPDAEEAFADDEDC